MKDDPTERLRTSWEANADAWSHAVRTSAMESRRLVTDRAVVDAVLDGAHERVLDVGCGEGWLARRLAEAGAGVVGIDGSSALIERAGDIPGVHFIALDYGAFVENPSAAGSAFDVVVCNFSILSESIVPLLGALHRSVRAGGRLVIQTIHPLTAVADGYADGWREESFEALPGQWQPMPWYHRTFGSWIRDVVAAGWRVSECREPLHPETGAPASLIIIAEG